MADLDLLSPRYELKDLTARAGVTARTVHFYIQQGLLPPAGAPGPGARYSEAFLARLVLIRRLQREHLPLAEIRTRLAALDDPAVMGLVALSADNAHGSAQRENSALDYVRTVLGESHAYSSSAGAEPPPPARSRSVGAELAPFDSASGSPEQPRGARPSSAGTAPIPGARSQWDRIVLALDVELHIRRPLTREQNKRVERLLVVAREILQEE